MSHYGGKELAASFRQVRGNTIQVAEDIPETHYGFKAAPEVRAVGQLLTHIALGPTIQLEVHSTPLDDLKKLNFQALKHKMGAEEAKSRTKSEIVALLKTSGETFATFLEGRSDQFLAEHVMMPPGASPASKCRLEMLLSPKEHEMHHRGQLMLIERIIGIVPHLTRQMQERMAQATRG